MKKRLDVLLVDRQLAESREQAQRLIRAGQVRVNDQLAAKPGHSFSDDVRVDVIATARFVSRGGDKMEAAFTTFEWDVTGRDCIDVGASTGGFTDCLLQHGARHVVAVDVGRGQLHWNLRNDPRVTVMEKINACYLTPDQLPYAPAVAVVDVSFISLTRILPALVTALTPDAQLVTLIKPQFEAGREQVEKGGVVRSDEVRQAVIDKIRVFGTDSQGLKWVACCTSPLKGPAGNVEFLAYWRKGPTT